MPFSVPPCLLAWGALCTPVQGDAAEGTAGRPLSQELSGPGDPTLVEGSLRLDIGPEGVPVWAAPEEELVFEVVIDLGLLGGAGVGSVTLGSTVERYVPGLAVPLEPDEPVLWAGTLGSAAEGRYLGYDLDHTLSTRFNPQAWPALIHRDVQAGSENRRREVMLGTRDGVTLSTYRFDGHCAGCERREHFVEPTLPWRDDFHCKKCKRAGHRLWREVRKREVPPGSMDMLTAVWVARAFVREGGRSCGFTMVDKYRLWDVTLLRGDTRAIETPAGTFESTEVLLRSEVPEGEEEREFAGLFGIRGELHIWVHAATGVPVVIRGRVPVGGLFDLGVRVQLEAARGTPAAFAPVDD
ncbi:MAG: DUF3108 domain-containing protein [Planctomycetota bacterium]|nr:DUF3108 domain-containing protein [Planctomycetota bacterium]